MGCFSDIFDSPDPPDMSGVNAAAQADVDFKKQVYEDHKDEYQKLLDLATQTASQQMGIAGSNQAKADQQWDYWNNRFKPAEIQTLYDSFQGQHLSPEEQQQFNDAMMGRLGGTRSTWMNYFSKLSADRAALEQKEGIMGVADDNREQLAFQRENALQGIQGLQQSGTEQLTGLRNQGIQDVAGLMQSELSYLGGREALDREAIDARIAGAYSQQGRALTRMGADPSRIAAVAGNLANQQALTRVTGMNQLGRDYSELTHGVRQRGGEQIAGLRQGYGQQLYGQDMGLGQQALGTDQQYRLMNYDQMSQARGQANDAWTNRYAAGTALRSGAANFGRNMPNTAGQAYGLATMAGNSAVANQNTGYMGALPYAQFGSSGFQNQLGAAGLQANIYNSQMQGYGGAMGGLGSLAGMGLMAFGMGK